jgi:hypothetical protein
LRRIERIRELVYPVAQLILVVLFVGIGFLLAGKTTLVIAVAVASGMVLSGMIYLVYTNRIMGVSHWQFLRSAVIPGLVPYLFGFGAAWSCSPLVAWAGTSRMRLAVAMFGSGLCYLSLVSAVLFRAFCPWGEREYLKKQVRHTFGGLWPGKVRNTVEVVVG